MGSASRRLSRASSAVTAATAIAAVSALAPAAAGARSADAHAARTLSLKESAHLRLDHHRGVVLQEHGTAKGTLAGPLYLQLRLTSTRSVTAQVQFYPGGGSIDGSAAASYRVVGSHATFSGRINVTGGSGRYSKAHGSGLSFSGTVQRSNDAITVYVSGRFSY